MLTQICRLLFKLSNNECLFLESLLFNFIFLFIQISLINLGKCLTLLFNSKIVLHFCPPSLKNLVAPEHSTNRWWCQIFAHRQFPKGDFPSDNFPSGNFPIGNFPNVWLVFLRRHMLQWGPSASARTEKGYRVLRLEHPMGNFHLENTLEKLPL